MLLQKWFLTHSQKSQQSDFVQLAIHLVFVIIPLEPGFVSAVL